MNRQEAVQYQMSGVSVLPNADLDFGQPTEFPCDDCGAMVDLTSIILVTMIEDGEGEHCECGDPPQRHAHQPMTEADARALLHTVGLPPPPVMCDQHDDPGPITTEALCP